MTDSWEKVPGVVIAGLRGGSGKTIISLGITAAWRQSGLKVAVFKKGPDYIDAGWLSRAAGRPCYNLDTYLCQPKVVRDSYLVHSQAHDICVVEGNRGLFDGIDTEGSTSTSELAKLIDLPVLLVMDCTKSTRTMAALLMGCMHFDRDINICGVVLNRVAGKRHEGKVRANIEKFCGIPVFGALPKLNEADFPERHMGLIPSQEHAASAKALETAASLIRRHVDLHALQTAVTKGFRPRIHAIPEPRETGADVSPSPGPTIGVVRDSAFQFYYPDNLDALARLGARIVFISPLSQEKIPDLDAIYMGGGFPETHAPQLAANSAFRNQLKTLSRQGLPIYAECGGLIFLGESILLGENTYPMTGILPVCFGLSKKPQGHGYTEVTVVRENPFYPKGEVLRGHEFRYSSILSINHRQEEMAFKMERGKGIVDKLDGFFRDNTLGTYTHIHALGTPSWAPSLIDQARRYKASRSS